MPPAESHRDPSAFADLNRLPKRGPVMKAPARKMRPIEIVETVIEKFVRAGVDLKTVTLEEFKRGISQVVRQMAG
jgi:hypothetical protein